MSAAGWWRSHKHALTPGPEVLNSILQLLTSVASSAGDEHVFCSYAWLVQSKLHNQLGTNKASKLVFLFKFLNQWKKVAIFWNLCCFDTHFDCILDIWLNEPTMSCFFVWPLSQLRNWTFLLQYFLHSAIMRCSLSTHGPWAFSVAGPSLWNSLPDSLRDPNLGRDSFRHLLKMHLFTMYWSI